MSTGAGIGMATNIIGGEMQGWAALLDKWAMQKQYQQEAATQAGYRQQAQGVLYGSPGVVSGQPQYVDTFPGAIPQSSTESAQRMIGEGADVRRQAYQDIGKIPLGTGFSPQSGYQGKADVSYTNLVGNARAQLGGYSDWAVNQAINNLRNQQALNQITSFAGGQARNVFPLEMYRAQHKQDALAAAGQAISSIGGAAGNYAQLYGQSPPGGGYGYTPVDSGNIVGPSLWSGYGGARNLPPAGTGYNPYTDQSTLFGAPSYYIPG